MPLSVDVNTNPAVTDIVLFNSRQVSYYLKYVYFQYKLQMTNFSLRRCCFIGRLFHTIARNCVLRAFHHIQSAVLVDHMFPLKRRMMFLQS